MIGDESEVALTDDLTRELDVASDLTAKRAMYRHEARVRECGPRGPLRGASQVFAVVFLAACAKDEPQPPAAGSTYGPPPTLPVVSAPESDGGDSGDGAADLDAATERCPESGEAPDFRFVSGFGGELTVAGTIVAAAVVEASRAVVLELTEVDGGEVRSAAFRTPGPPRDRFRYRITGLRPGRWLVRAQIDQVGQATVGDTGDLEGFYAGTEAAPLRDPAEADAIDLSDRCVEDADFGIGVKL